MDADLRNAKENLIHSQSDLKIVEGKINNLENQKMILVDEKENSDNRIKQFTEVKNSAKVEIDKIQGEIDALENTINSLNDDTSELSKKREEIRLKTEEINVEIVSLTKDIESAKITIDELNFRKAEGENKNKDISFEIAQINAKNNQIQKDIDVIKEQINELRLTIINVDSSIKEKIDNRDLFEKTIIENRSEQKEKIDIKEKLASDIVRLEEQKSTMQREYDNLNDMLFEQYELTRYEAAELNIVVEDMTAAKHRLNELKQAIKALGSINVGAVEEYKEVSERYEFLKEQISDIEKSRSELNKIIEDLTKSMSEKFMTQFERINAEFKNSFIDFFGGGKGEIILEDKNNCLESPIEIKIQPPGKSVQNINLFSGGE